MKHTFIATIFTLVTMAGQAQTNEPFFRTDSAFIFGKNVGLEAEAMPKQISVEWNNALTNFTKYNLVNVATDGSFTCRMQLQHPILSYSMNTGRLRYGIISWNV